MWGEEGRGLCKVGHEDRQENPRFEDQVGCQGRCVQEVQAALWEGRPDLIISNPEKKDSWIVLDNQQSEAVNRAVEEKTHLVGIEGLPGSGKTIIGAEIVRRLVEKTKEETGEDPVVIITKGTCQKRFSGIRPLRGGVGVPPFSAKEKNLLFSPMIFR